jgi:tRNA pseudouridine32 synthase/23S rRNA pseudouridine746 synthase
LTSTTTDIAVVYADDALVVLNKPAGLLSVPGRGDDKQDCLSARVQQCFSDACIVHRLDMATSGLLVMARGALAQRTMNAAFASRTVHKRYQAIVDGTLRSDHSETSEHWNTIDLPIHLDWENRPRRVINALQGKPSSTRWRTLSIDSQQQTTRVELEPVTGRSHQLRVHLLAINHPILGDALYAPEPVSHKSARLLLHATEIELPHPLRQTLMRFTSLPPF